MRNNSSYRTQFSQTLDEDFNYLDREGWTVTAETGTLEGAPSSSAHLAVIPAKAGTAPKGTLCELWPCMVTAASWVGPALIERRGTGEVLRPYRAVGVGDMPVSQGVALGSHVSAFQAGSPPPAQIGARTKFLDSN